MFTEERAHWLYRNYRWLEDHLPARVARTKPTLVLPTSEFYPMPNTRNHAFAQGVFERTKTLMGVGDWRCRLAPQSEEEHERQASLRSAGVFGETKSSGAVGTFFVGEEVEITYAPTLLRDPMGLVATMAHELCHYLLATVRAEPPCGWKEHEPLTDLAAVAEGFGIFLCNSAFQFSQWTNHSHMGWQWSKHGYLNEAELGFALGVFCVRTNTPAEQVGGFLKQNPAEVFWDSIDYILELEVQPSG
jgi:hypothetical protein